MESSIGMVFRAFVMLACLAVVPGLAMYGKYIPELINAVVTTYKARTQAAQTPPPSKSPDGGSAPSAVPPAAQRTDAPNRWTDNGPAPRPLSDWQGGGKGGPTPPSDLRQATFTEPVPTAPSSAAGGLGPAAANPSNASPAPAASGAPGDCSAQFSAVEQRLRQLGSTYYLLEAWGPDTQQYRFICHVPLAGSSRNARTRIFEAMSSSPLEAMQQVLTQIETWRAESGRQ